MTLQRHSRRVGGDPAAQIAAKRRLRHARRTTTEADDTAVITFLSDLLVGDSSWTLGEVQRLVAFRDHTGTGDDAETELNETGTTGV